MPTKNSYKYTFDQVKKICADKGFILLEDEYFGSKHKMKYRCVKCGFVRACKFSHVLSGHGCASCKKCAKLTPQDIIARLNKNNLSPTGDANFQTNKRIQVKCNICNHERKLFLSNILGQHRCPKCAQKLKYTTEYVRSFIASRNGKMISKKYENIFTKLDVSCNICNERWRPTFKNILAGSWCPSCSNILVRKPHRYIVSVLEDIFPGEAIFSNYKGFEWLVYKERQEVDIWVPCVKLAIEYDGEQHFRPIEYFGGEEGFRKTVARDENKDKLISLHPEEVRCFIRFSYKDKLTKQFITNKIKQRMPNTTAVGKKQGEMENNNDNKDNR